jgi:Ca2+-binding RTX toxin-like protein
MATINGTSGNDKLKGTATADRINGRAGDDNLNGGNGNDTLDGGAGYDTLRGGGGNDLYLIADSPNEILDTGGFDTVFITHVDTHHLADGIEVLVVKDGPTQPGAITAYGNDLDNTLRNDRTDNKTVYFAGMGGDDVLIGGGAGEYFDSSSESGDYGNDYVDGGGADDILAVGGHSRVVVDFREGFARGGGIGGSGTVTFVNIEIVSTGDFNDRVIGNAASQKVYGAGGNDTLIGGGGDDYLNGDTQRYLDVHTEHIGHDRLLGGAGNDTLAGGDGDDYLDGGAGSDYLFGGGGVENRLVWDPADIKVDGSAARAILLVRQNLDLRNVEDSKVEDIDRIDMTGHGNNRFTLTAQDLLAISESDTLEVLGNAGDSINIVGEFTDEGVEGGFHRYTVGEGTLLVDTDITNVA